MTVRSGIAALVASAACGTLLLAPASAAPLSADRSAVTTNSSGMALFRVTTSDPVFFITIDDGWSHQRAAADYVRQQHLPVTVFLTDAAVRGDWSFFARMAAYGSVQNHSMTHPALTAVSQARREREICGPQSVYRSHYGSRPWLLRPPFGAGYMPRRASTPLIESTARSCGISRVVLWNVTMSESGSMSFAGAPYRRGDIVLLHFKGDLADNLRKLVRLYAAHGLRPARLEHYLPRP